MNKPAREGFVVVEDEPVTAQPSPVEAPPPEPLPEPLPDAWPLVIQLRHKPIQKSKVETVDELTFREPTAADIIRAGGNPCRIEITSLADDKLIYNPVIDDTRMIRIMASLCGIHEQILKTMDTRDYNSCAYRLRKFFLAEQGLW